MRFFPPATYGPSAFLIKYARASLYSHASARPWNLRRAFETIVSNQPSPSGLNFHPLIYPAFRCASCRATFTPCLRHFCMSAQQVVTPAFQHRQWSLLHSSRDRWSRLIINSGDFGNYAQFRSPDHGDLPISRSSVTSVPLSPCPFALLIPATEARLPKRFKECVRHDVPEFVNP